MLYGTEECIDEDVKWLEHDAERLGYPTQKPEGLLMRIVQSSCPTDGIVLDPFCGCGTALVAAQKLGRRWVGIDVTYLAIAVMRARLKDHFRLEDVPVVGRPTEVEGARQLAQSPEGRYQFQWWAVDLVGAMPVGGTEKKGADRGIDGKITFTATDGKLETVLVSVKSGHVNSSMVRDLKGTIDREKAAIGLFITLEESSKEMRLEADTAGLYRSELWKRDYPRIQILTIKELLEEGKKPELPPFVMPTYQQAQRVSESAGEQRELFDAGPGKRA
jgi:site-specific DNA-methyltransferase (adenine-specific)